MRQTSGHAFTEESIGKRMTLFLEMKNQGHDLTLNHPDSAQSKLVLNLQREHKAKYL